MGILKAIDFYCGSFLSALLNSSENKASLFDNTGQRRIYRLTTDNAQNDYMIYTKYVRRRKNKSDSSNHWVFKFEEDEILKIISLHDANFNVKLALICVCDNLSDSEVAIVDYDVAIECIGFNKGIKPYRLNVIATGGKHGLRLYGSGRSDKLNGKDNTKRIDRDAIAKL